MYINPNRMEYNKKNINRNEYNHDQENFNN